MSPPPLGGTQSLGGEGVGGSQFGRGDRHCGTLGTVQYTCTLCAEPSVLTSLKLSPKDVSYRVEFKIFLESKIMQKYQNFSK